MFDTQLAKAVPIKPVTSQLPVIFDEDRPVFNVAYEETDEPVDELVEVEPHPMARRIEDVSITIASTITSWTGHLSTKIEE